MIKSNAQHDIGPAIGHDAWKWFLLVLKIPILWADEMEMGGDGRQSFLCPIFELDEQEFLSPWKISINTALFEI